ncbi:hypothetical protein NQ317_014796 [Molorchus minor]|uniref:Nose resistant-to-fluoxetine protein N-terminal domain-containing protein n=1 Tax=Molorchus minor TaxID=1323400 RepID=A0ABQ9IWW8_9CUCU|nr:hypothetical protein NQ317_014796 [Molorchus minor]
MAEDRGPVTAREWKNAMQVRYVFDHKYKVEVPSREEWGSNKTALLQSKGLIWSRTKGSLGAGIYSNHNALIILVYDSTAKLPSGILNGNINQFGDFDMCLGAKLESRNIFGQYCLTSMEIEAPRSSYLAGLHKLIQSHYHFRSKLEDVNKWFMAFSVRKNLTSMGTIKVSSDDIETVHGIRFINAILLLLSHKSMALFFQPFSNRTEYVECLTHTHHVGIDTQLFLVSPFFILTLWKWPKKGTIFLVTLAAISTLMRYYVTYTMRLSNYVHFGTS